MKKERIVNYIKNNQDFTESTRLKLMIRASLRCLNPNCRRLTAAYNASDKQFISIGEAATLELIVMEDLDIPLVMMRVLLKMVFGYVQLVIL